MLNEWAYKHTLKCYCFSTATMVARRRLSVTLYVLYCLIFMVPYILVIKVLLKFQLDVFYLFICRLYMFRATPIFRSFKCTLQTIGVCTSFDVLFHWIRYWLGHPRTCNQQNSTELVFLLTPVSMMITVFELWCCVVWKIRPKFLRTLLLPSSWSKQSETKCFIIMHHCTNR